MSEFSIDKVKNLPQSPGVYLMKGKDQEIIYIGKAIRLRSRVSSYFAEHHHSNHFASYVLKYHVCDLDWIVTGSEIEALILEANLIKKYKPKYNVLLKDDKRYPYLKITNEPFPRVLVTRKVYKDGGKYYGPFTDTGAMRRTLRFIHKSFKVRDCTLTLPPKKWEKPCLYYHMGYCDAPCAYDGLKEEYQRNILLVSQLLKGQQTELLKNLNQSMLMYSKEQNFEKAKLVRDQIRDIQSLLAKQRVDLAGDLTSKDVIGFVREGELAVVTLLEIREALVISKKQFRVDCSEYQSNEEILQGALENYYQQAEIIPSEILLGQSIQESSWLETLLEEKTGKKIKLFQPKIGEKVKVVSLAQQNAHQRFSEIKAEDQKKKEGMEALVLLKQVLKLPQMPLHIEGFDISHLGGTGTVASKVVFRNGYPSKKDYRKYDVKTVEGINDFASMKEILTRRIQRLQEKMEELPHLILIDGGKGQLSAVVEVLENSGLSIPVIGLAKRIEEIFLPHHSTPILLEKNHPSLQLLQWIRNESHRFAITFQRSKRVKEYTQSALLNISGIGEETMKKLLLHFGSFTGVAEASKEAIIEVVGKSKYAKIWEYIQNSKKDI